MRYLGDTPDRRVYIVIIDSKNYCYKLDINTYVDFKKVYDKRFAGFLFEKVTTVSNVKEIYNIYNFSTTLADNNRDIYLNDIIRSYKFKKAYMDPVLTGKINYIISNENYLYDEYLNLVHDKRIDSVLVRAIM